MRLVVLDIDGGDGLPYLDALERAALARTAALLPRDLAILTRAGTAEAVRACMGAEALGLRAHVLSDRDPRARVAGSPDRAHALAELCARLGCSFTDVAVIAAHPEDAPAALEAGCVLALEDAGPLCRSIAERALPARAQGGLARALDMMGSLTGEDPGR